MNKYLFLLALSSALMADENVTLNNGQQYSVKTTFGKPVLNSNEYLTFGAIAPCYDKMDGWRKIRYYWSISFGFNKNFNGTITIDSPLLSNKSWSWSFNTTPSINDYLILHRLEAMESESTPEMWEWVNESGESWIPFRFIIKPDASGNSINFIEWVKINEKEKSATRLDFKKIETLYRSNESKEIISITKEKFNIKTNKSEPLRFDNNFLQIDSLFPGVFDNKLPGKPRTFAFSISGKYRGMGELILAISSPAISKSFFHKVKIKNAGQFHIPFAFSDLSPECWNWLESEGDFWIPIQIQVDKNNTQELLNFTEWVHVTNEVRSEIKRLSKISPTP